MKRRHILYAALVGAALLVVFFIFVYDNAPFGDDVSDLVVNLFYPFVALLCASGVTAVFSYYQRGDRPYGVWLHFLIGIWSWVMAEVSWVITYMAQGEVPSPALPDLFWFIGYFLFSLALLRQYELVFRQRIALWVLGLLWLGVILLTALAIVLTGNIVNAPNMVEFCYAIADFALGLAAMRLLIAFGGGKLSRPWVGLLVLGISDGLYAWAYATGMYAFSASQGSILSMLIDSIYVAAYLVLTVGFLSQWLLLRLGPDEIAAPVMR